MKPKKKKKKEKKRPKEGPEIEEGGKLKGIEGESLQSVLGSSVLIRRLSQQNMARLFLPSK